MEKINTTNFIAYSKGLVIVLLSIFCFQVFAQPDPYLLLQGSSKRTTYRFMKGEAIEWRLVGEDEFFKAQIRDLFPESGTLRIEDMILRPDQIAEIRFEKRGSGLRTYFTVQGIVNLSTAALAYSFSEQVRERQQRFVIGGSIISAFMVLYGQIGRRAKRKINENGPFLLQVVGG